MTGCRARSPSLWVHRNLLKATVTSWKLAWFGHVTHHNSLSKTVLQGTCEGVQYCGWHWKCWIETLKSGHPCPRQNCSQWPPTEKTGRGSLLNHPLCPPDDPLGQETELNGTDEDGGHRLCPMVDITSHAMPPTRSSRLITKHCKKKCVPLTSFFLCTYQQYLFPCVSGTCVMLQKLPIAESTVLI